MRLFYWLFSGLSAQRLYPVTPTRRYRSAWHLIGLVVLAAVLLLLLRHLYSYYLGAINLPD